MIYIKIIFLLLYVLTKMRSFKPKIQLKRTGVFLFICLLQFRKHTSMLTVFASSDERVLLTM